MLRPKNSIIVIYRIKGAQKHSPIGFSPRYEVLEFLSNVYHTWTNTNIQSPLKVENICDVIFPQKNSPNITSPQTHGNVNTSRSSQRVHLSNFPGLRLYHTAIWWANKDLDISAIEYHPMSCRTRQISC